MAATNPADLNLTANDIPLRQEDFELMIGLYPPDKFHKNNLKIEKVFSVSFNFSERELLHLFSSSYASHTFKEGDLILLNGCDHTMFATIQNGQFILYNPLPLIFSDPNIFVAVLWKFLSSAERLHEKYTALGINIYEALTPDQKVSARPMRSKIIKKIMDDSTDIERKSRDESVLWTAAYYGHEDTFESLIKHRAPILYKSHSGTTVALAAAMNNQQRILESIYQISKNLLLRKDNKNHTPLKFAAQFGNIEFLKLTVGMFKPGEYLEAAQIAIRDEKKEFLKFLLDNKLISNSDILVIAKVATYLKKTHMLILLGSYGLDLKDDSLMTYAVIQNSLPIVRYLGEEKALRERSDRTPLVMEAVIKGSEKMVHLLHEYKISVNIIDSHTGYTPAHVAIRNNKSSLLQALAECKADFNIPDLKGKTALHYAVTKQDTATIALLITHGAKYDITDSKHQTPFDYASPELKYFIILQQFRVFIKTQYNDEDRPFYLSTCLKIINDSESTKQWEEAFKKLRERILAQYPYATKKQRTHPILIPSIKNDDIEYFINLCAELPLQRSLSSQNKKRKEI
jgi:ankyrin repeat protein